jgi:citrate lyase subunit beta / citryl-CoA lyase
MTLRLRRSELSTPASSPKMIEKAMATTADMVFLDLEDAVAPAQKEAARKNAVDALRNLDWGKKVRAVRVNGADTHWAHDDVIEVVEGAGDKLDVIIVPKPKAPRDIWFFDTLLTQLETKLHLKNRIGLEALIEESAALARVEEIAAASPRLEALILGFGDLSASQGMRFGVASDPALRYPGDMWHHARVRMITACRRDRRAVRQFQGSQRLPARGDLGGDARRGRQMGDSSEPNRNRQRRFRADAARNRERAQDVRSVRGRDA